MRFVTFGQAVYSDEFLTQEVLTPMTVKSTTNLPKGVYISNGEHTLTGRNAAGTFLWSCTFSYPDDVEDGVIINGVWV